MQLHQPRQSRTKCIFRERTLGLLEGGRRVFAGIMKKFGHMFMGHEIFLKIFDGPQKILCVSCLIFFKFLLKSCGSLSAESS